MTTPSMRSRWGATWAVIVVVVISLAAVDQFLERVESAEIRNTAQRSYLTGVRLLKEGNANKAVDSLRDAHALDRSNPEYELELVAALTAAGKASEAEPLLTELLQREPNDGRANLIAARLAVRNGDMAGAESYYHRAIYGEWSGDAAARRVSARMELVDLLANKNQKQELLAELISLEAETPSNKDIQKRLAKLFLQAGAPGRAANVYEALAEKDPTDIAAYEGIGEARLDQGQYPAAREAFLRASLRNPGDESVRAHLHTLETVTALDPTERHLTSAEKYSRSIRILEMTREAVGQCVGTDQSSDPNQQLLKTADATIAAKVPAHATNEAAEGVLSLAEMLWHTATTTTTSGCVDRRADQPALALIMQKLSS